MISRAWRPWRERWGGGRPRLRPPAREPPRVASLRFVRSEPPDPPRPFVNARPAHGRRIARLAVLCGVAGSLAVPARAAAQNAGSILGRVVDTSTGEALQDALFVVEGTELRTSSAPDGRIA